MNPQQPYQQSGGHDILPPPMKSSGQPLGQPATQAAQPQFPGIGMTLPRLDALPRQPVVPPRKSRKKLVKRILLTLLVIALLAGGYVGVKALINIAKSFNGNLFGLVQNDKLKGEDVGRVNILLAGNSADDAGHSGGDLTDSIMLISLDTTNNTAFVMSIPRDLWVDVPDNGYTKINAAYVYGKQKNFTESGYPNGGMGLLEKTVEQDFDVDINYYALVNYTALRQAVDAVGGIDVTITSSDPRGLYDPSKDYSKSPPGILVKLPNGVNHLDGQTALNLARARGDNSRSYGYAQSDFTRTTNQRLMLAALKVKATSAGVVSNPIKLGSLLDSIGNNVQTDFQTTEIRRLVSLTQKIPDSSLKSVSLNDAAGKNLLTSYRTYNGQSALIPAAGIDDYSAINSYLESLLQPPATTTTTTTSTTNQ